MGSQDLSAWIWGRKPGMLMFLVCYKVAEHDVHGTVPLAHLAGFRPSCVQHTIGRGVTPGSQPANEGISRSGLQE